MRVAREAGSISKTVQDGRGARTQPRLGSAGSPFISTKKREWKMEKCFCLVIFFNEWTLFERHGDLSSLSIRYGEKMKLKKFHT